MAIVTPVETPAGAPRRLRLSSPVDHALLGDLEIQTPDEVRGAVAAARKAQPAWAELSVRERGRFMERAARLLAERQDEFVEVVVRESGKPANEARMMEIFAGCDSLQYWAKHAPRILAPRRRRLHGMVRLTKKLRVAYRPLGVVGVISPWNGPFILALNPTVQALMAGNAVVLKPSEVTPRSGALVGELLAAAGLPDGVLSVLSGDGETGAALVEAEVDKIAFTGGVATGRAVAEACARRLVPCTLELGGKDPMIVCEDADVERAAGGAIAGAFLNTGQYCCGTERVYAADAIADAFTEAVVERAGRLRQGAEGEFDVGPLCWERQLQVVERHVADALARGATLRVGGRRNPELSGLYYEPTVLTGVSQDMQVMREETFGPVLPILRVRDEEEAIALANASPYGLAASVWTRDPRRGVEIARRLDCGSVCINDVTMTYGALEAPFGGRKHSGIGQVNGEEGLRAFCAAQPVLIDRFGGRQAAAHYPYTAKKDDGLRRLIQWLWGTSLGRWLS